VADESILGGVSFSTRLFGFDRQEVLSFVSNLLSEYQEVSRQLEQLKGEVGLDRKKKATHAFQHEEAARVIEQTLESAHHLADEIRVEGEQKAARLIGDAESLAASLLERSEAEAKRRTEAAEELRVESEQKAARVCAEAQARAAAMIERAEAEIRQRADAGRARVREIEQDIERMQTRHAQVRASLESTLATLGETLTRIGASPPPDDVVEERRPLGTVFSFGASSAPRK
jgi:cell division septum initiation protein DivIVA